jgi:uncharacterized NAD-dependent epimerase/dehydratase family protein
MHLQDAFDSPVPAIVFAEGEFGRTGGKTAHGVVMHSRLFDVRAVIDSRHAGETTRDVLGKQDDPPVAIVSSLEEASDRVPDAEAFVIGVAPAGGALPDAWINVIEDAVRAQYDIVSGLHSFLSEDPKWQELAARYDIRLFDVRKPPAGDKLRVVDGSREEIDATVVLTMGTDCAVGKRTTTVELYDAARARGIEVAWIATGQTGIMIGADHGVVIDRVPADFAAGVIESMVTDVDHDADLIFIEGQASLTHRAYSGVTLSILHGAWPDAVILADDPARSVRTHYEMFDVDGFDHERTLIESLSAAEVVAASTWGPASELEDEYGVPTVNVYDNGASTELLNSVLDHVGMETSEDEGMEAIE